MIEPLRILIVDDELPARERLATLLDDIGEAMPNVVVGSVGDGLAAIEVLSSVSADVVLTDIRMPRMGGIELAMHLQRHLAPPALVFTTAYDHHAVQAFELNAVDYLLKPIRAERLLTALRRASQGGGQVKSGVTTERLQAVSDGPRRFFSCSERGRLIVVPVSEVVYLRAETKYVTAKTIGREYLLDESLHKLEEEFSADFLRLHRSVLVAKRAVSGFEKLVDVDGEHWVAVVSGLSERLPVSRRQWPIVKRATGF